MYDDMAFGQRVKQYRKDLDLTQEDFAERVGCSIETVSKIERGERRPSKQVAERMAQVLELPLESRAAFVRAARALPAESSDRPELAARAAPPAPALSIHSPSPAQPEPPVVGAPHKPRMNLPAPPTPLVGRAAELAELAALLDDPSCRLLTLTGPGGIGKTRLAIETAALHAGAFADGVAFVSLATVGSPDLLPAIADALGFGLYDQADLSGQLLEYLREKSLLILLDNFEHLLDASDLLVEVLQRAPSVKLLVTSRERLNLQGEWVFELQGLSLPKSEQAADFDAAGAVALFLQSARRARAGFALPPAERACVARICRLVEGMPLAIELAASWVRVLPCNEIAAEIERTIDFLAASARDLPARHRSLRAVFEHSWNLLTEDERAVLRALSVFRGGFRREAAEWVAGATLPLLTALVDKSLLRRSGTGRYDIHELVRQYAAARLDARPDEQAAIRDRHSGYYMTLVQHREKILKRARQRAVIDELVAEMDNLRLAWDWAATHERLADLGRALRGLSWLYELRSWFHEGEAMLRRAVEAIRPAGDLAASDDARALTLGQLMAFEGWFRFRQGRYASARELLEGSLALLRSCGDRAALADALTFLGWACQLMGDYQLARESMQEGLELAREVGESWMTILCTIGLGSLAIGEGRYAEAERLSRAGLNEALALGSVRAVAFSISAVTQASMALGQFEEAQTLLRASFATSSAIGDYWGVGSALTHLGMVALAQGEYAEAQYMFREAVATSREIGDRWSMGRALECLGATATALGEHREAWRAFRDAWRIATEAQVAPLALDTLVGLAGLLANEGASDQAQVLVDYIVSNPTASQPARGRAERLRAQLGASLELGQPAPTPMLDRAVGQLIEGLFGAVQ
ncbi:MAG: tetratricopeptide repeat protein [Kouleothrix sp.]|nr:tetratricopeptide repeat protein [Kouleothrix sp.]